MFAVAGAVVCFFCYLLIVLNVVVVIAGCCWFGCLLGLLSMLSVVAAVGVVGAVVWCLLVAGIGVVRGCCAAIGVRCCCCLCGCGCCVFFVRVVVVC